MMLDRIGHLSLTRREVTPGVASALTRERVRHRLGRRGIRVDDAAVLVTCERVEVYVHASPHELLAAMTRLRRLGPVETGRRTVEHLHRVAAGLESRCVGECHVLGQVRRTECGPWLRPLFRSAVHAGRVVRRETALGRIARSCVDRAVERLADLPAGASVAVVGGGRLAREVCTRLQLRGLRVTIVARPYASIERVLSEVVAVVAASASPVPVIESRHLRPRPAPARLIDLGEPPNIADDIEAIRLDDLASEPGSSPAGVLAEATSIVDDAVERYTLAHRWRSVG